MFNSTKVKAIRVKLEKAEKSGFTAETKLQILKQSKRLLKKSQLK